MACGGSVALVLHLWDLLLIWRKGLGVFNGWVHAGVHSFGLWMNRKGSFFISLLGI